MIFTTDRPHGAIADLMIAASRTSGSTAIVMITTWQASGANHSRDGVPIGGETSGMAAPAPLPRRVDLRT